MLTPDAGRRPPALPAALALAAAAAAFAWAAWRMRGFTVDDAYITLRYARHVAAGLGPVWNAGSRDEGYTSPLWMLLLVPPHLLHLDALAAAKAMGVATTLATAWVLARWRPGGAAPADALAAAALWLALPATAVHAISGMETALAALFVTLLFRAGEEAVRSERAGAARALPFLALLAGFA
ncbi:MAG TPA: hypothetical protein VGU27_07125, partial [Candidatus Eisenbacteria bacterium]|nr:hypothetical protein [Candidatus Eisenbacteria bacterium]